MRVHLPEGKKCKTLFYTPTTQTSPAYSRGLVKSICNIRGDSSEDFEFLVVDSWFKHEVLKKHQENFISGLNLTGQV